MSDLVVIGLLAVVVLLALSLRAQSQAARLRQEEAAVWQKTAMTYQRIAARRAVQLEQLAAESARREPSSAVAFQLANPRDPAAIRQIADGTPGGAR